MPSDRFNKLKTVKKGNFLKKAYKEFSLHSYEGASITQLVSDLKMAKGSIYQYFENKEDLYNYLVDHAYSQLHVVLEKACPISSSNEGLDLWYKNYLLVHLKFLCAIPSYALLLIRYKTEFSKRRISEELKIVNMIRQSSREPLAEERVYQLSALPLLVFKYLVEAEQIEVDKIIESGGSIDISSDKLLYLCEAFLNND